MNKRMAVIMAGGTGERFWPLSRQVRPKQLLNLTVPDQSVLGEAVARLLPMIPAENILIVTGRHLVEPIQAANIGIPAANILAEPCKRNTAGCLSFVAAHLLATYGKEAADISLAVVTADHQIRNPVRFRSTVEAAMTAAEQYEALVTIGIRPTRPETGYGYIEISLGGAPVYTSPQNVSVYPAARFREKPDLRTAQQYMTSGLFFWNSGMFFWRLSTFLQEMQAVSPHFAGAICRLEQELRRGDAEAVENIFSQLPSISIDYALMEKAAQVLVTQGDFLWDDIGAWDALDRSFVHDANGNVAVGDPVLVDTRNCIIYNEPGASQIAVGVLGMDNVAVVVAGDAVLVVPKNRAQDVRKIVDELRHRNARQA